MEIELIEGERLVASVKANLVIRPADYGLGRFAADQLLWAVGMQGKESIGGKAHVTDCRVAFVAHRFNRLKGTLSIPVTEIESVIPYWRGPAVGVDIMAGGVAHNLITWSRRRLVDAIRESRSAGAGASVTTDELRVNKVAQVMNLAVIGVNAADDAREGLDSLSLAWARRTNGQ